MAFCMDCVEPCGRKADRKGPEKREERREATSSGPGCGYAGGESFLTDALE